MDHGWGGYNVHRSTPLDDAYANENALAMLALLEHCRDHPLCSHAFECLWSYQQYYDQHLCREAKTSRWIIVAELVQLACLVTRQSLNLQCCYIHFGYLAVEGENAGLLSLHPSAWPRGTRPWIVTRPTLSCPMPSTGRPPTPATAMRLAQVAGTDLMEIFRGIEYFYLGSSDFRWWWTPEVWCFYQDNRNQNCSLSLLKLTNNRNFEM